MDNISPLMVIVSALVIGACGIGAIFYTVFYRHGAGGRSKATLGDWLIVLLSCAVGTALACLFNGSSALIGALVGSAVTLLIVAGISRRR